MKNYYECNCKSITDSKKEMNKNIRMLIFLVKLSMGGIVADPWVIPVTIDNHKQNC